MSAVEVVVAAGVRRIAVGVDDVVRIWAEIRGELSYSTTLGGTSQTFSEDNLGVGVLAAGADVSLLRADGQGQVEISLARSEAGAAAGFTQVTPPTPTPTPTPQTGLPATGGGTSFLVPALMLMGIGGTALFGLRRRRS